jgi:hypothetical protein
MQDSDDHTLDVEDLVASAPTQGAENVLPKAERKAMVNGTRRSVEPFDKFPRWWSHLLRNAGVGSFKIALLLLYLNWKSGGRPVTVSAAAAKARGVGPRQKVSAVLELEKAGIVRVERRPKKSSLITVLLSPPVVPKRS